VRADLASPILIPLRHLLTCSCALLLHFFGLRPKKSGRRDLNLRPHGPEQSGLVLRKRLVYKDFNAILEQQEFSRISHDFP
jgi:hypothetical protein